MTASATAAATALANPAAMSFTFTEDFLPPGGLIRLIAAILLPFSGAVAAASCCFSNPPPVREVVRELGLLGLVKWLISSDDDDDEMGLAGPSSFRDGCCSSWVVMGAPEGDPAGDGTPDDGFEVDPDVVSWYRVAAAVDGLLLLLLLLLVVVGVVDSDDNKHDDDADADDVDDDDDDD